MRYKITIILGNNRKIYTTTKNANSAKSRWRFIHSRVPSVYWYNTILLFFYTVGVCSLINAAHKSGCGDDRPKKSITGYRSRLKRCRRDASCIARFVQKYSSTETIQIEKKVGALVEFLNVTTDRITPLRTKRGSLSGGPMYWIFFFFAYTTTSTKI